jgi:hypothetical protein
MEARHASMLDIQLKSKHAMSTIASSLALVASAFGASAQYLVAVVQGTAPSL